MPGTYNRGKFLLAGGSATPVDWDTSDIRALLVHGTYTFAATHNFVSDIGTGEVSGGNYTAASRRTTTRTVVENDGAGVNRAELTCANILWSALSTTQSPNGVVFYRETATSPTDANRELISWHEFTATATNGGDFTVSFTGTNAILLT
jgi:hypothetical protein